MNKRKINKNFILNVRVVNTSPVEKELSASGNLWAADL